MDHSYILFFTRLRVSFKVAGSGNVEEFEQLIRDNPSNLKVTNTYDLCAAHNAATHNRVGILAMILQYDGGI
jgi:hypothetical protein